MTETGANQDPAPSAPDRNGISATQDVSFEAGGTVTVQETVSGAKMNVVAGGDVAFGTDGQVSGSSVAITAGSNITQEDATVSTSGGYVSEERDIHTAVSANDVTLTANSGSIGSADKDSASYVGVEASSLTAKASGDVAVAGGNGSDLNISSIEAGNNVNVYTTGTINPEGTIKAEKEITMNVKSYTGGIVPISTGSKLTVNNFRNSSSGNPLLAIFNTDGGNQRPDTPSQHNDTIIFIDGRLAGGDLMTINKLGAMEAFPVQTPELKSEQGVFGNPTFLHDELDVANPIAVGAIDFLLQEIPVLTLSSDFPIEVEKQVAASGLSPTTSYRFGQRSLDDEKETEDESESTDSGKDGEKSSGGDESAVKTAMN